MPPMATDLSLTMYPQAFASPFSLCLDTATNEVSSTVVHNPYDLNGWRKPYALWARSLPDWTSPIPEWTAPNMFTNSEPFLRPRTMKTQPPRECGLSTSQSCEPWHNDSKITLSQAEPRPSWTSASLASSSSVTRVSTPSHLPPTVDTASLSASATPPSAMLTSSVLPPRSVPRMTCKLGYTSPSLHQPEEHHPWGSTWTQAIQGPCPLPHLCWPATCPPSLQPWSPSRDSTLHLL